LPELSENHFIFLILDKAFFEVESSEDDALFEVL